MTDRFVHRHLHALVPGAGPSLDGQQWNTARHPKHRRRRKPYLTDNVKLGRVFRKHYIQGLKRLLRNGTLKLGGKVGLLDAPEQRRRWFEQLEQTDWNVFIQGPPNGKSAPEQVVKYLASYLTGGPIADGRLIRFDQDEVHFWARPKQAKLAEEPNGQSQLKNQRKQHKGMNAQRPYRLSGRQFMQRWALHILPKGYTRSRCYGGYHGSKRTSYLKQCCELLTAISHDAAEDTSTLAPDETVEPSGERTCPHCKSELTLIYSERRPSWRNIFEQDIYRLDIYSPQHHIGHGRSPPSGPAAT